MTEPPHSTHSLLVQVKAMGAWVRQFIGTHPVPAWVMAFLVWAPSYGAATIPAVTLLMHPLPEGQLPWTTDPEPAVASAALSIMLLYIMCVFLHMRGFQILKIGITPRKDRREWFWIPAAFLMACGANFVKTVMTDHAQEWFPTHTHLYRSEATSENALPSLLISMLTTGPAEEIILVPGLILLLISGRCPQWLAITIAVTARTAFHLYYGLPVAPGFVVWALLLVLIWQVTGTALGALLAHILNNFIAALGHTTAFNSYAWDVVYTWLSVAGIILLIALIPQAVRTLKCLRSTLTPAHVLTHAVECPPIGASFATPIAGKHTR